MAIIGQIQGVAQSSGIEREQWIELIASHPQLLPVPPRTGINPFTHKPTEFKAPATTAIISTSEAELGSISWAMDGSPVLLVQANADAEERVERIAESIAISLGGRFIRLSDDEETET